MNRYLTKSRFKTGIECATKLYYTGNKAYADRKLDDPFLAALAEGGYQVGELAKLYHPGGEEVFEIDHATAVENTNRLLAREAITIFEGAFLYKDLFVRADIVEKSPGRIILTEVKAKSFGTEEKLLKNNGEIRSEWVSYLFDIAFQVYVIKNAIPDVHVSARLMLADKSAIASVDGLNQQFLIVRDGKRKKVIIADDITHTNIGNRILTSVDVDTIVRDIHAGLHSGEPFDQLVETLASNYVSNTLMEFPLSSACGKCEFRASEIERKNRIRSGFHECWTRAAGFTDADFAKPSVLSLWDFRKKNEFIQAGNYFMDSVSWEDLQPKTKPKKTTIEPGLSRNDRQWKQIQLSRPASNPFFDKEGMSEVMSECNYPLHFIDFETTSVAIPFYKGMRPYEQVAFQFSHHVMEKDGSIRHADEWINTQKGYFPNYEFVRALKKSLSSDNGSIFMYHHHENNILNAIYVQLQSSAEADKVELCNWIKTITKSSSGAVEIWEGSRKMIDLRQWVLRYYYSPNTGGSNSIKAVLPAIISESSYLQGKYSQPVYGTEAFPSRNFIKHAWLKRENDTWQDPYKLLPKVHTDVDDALLDSFVIDEEAGIADGGAAMMAYAKMQFSLMNDDERAAVTKGLLRYCEPDTMAMVMLWEGWANWS